MFPDAGSSDPVALFDPGDLILIFSGEKFSSGIENEGLVAAVHAGAQYGTDIYIPFAEHPGRNGKALPEIGQSSGNLDLSSRRKAQRPALSQQGNSFGAKLKGSGTDLPFSSGVLEIKVEELFSLEGEEQHRCGQCCGKKDGLEHRIFLYENQTLSPCITVTSGGVHSPYWIHSITAFAVSFS